jgi:hypothetical protein
MLIADKMLVGFPEVKKKIGSIESAVIKNFFTKINSNTGE